MYFYLTLEQLKEILLVINIDISLFTSFEQTVVLILGNIFLLVSWYFIFRSFYFIWVRAKRILGI